jgi:hypothetical protein
VEKRDVGPVMMSELKIGDHIQTANGAYTQVYGFSHIKQMCQFLQLPLEYPMDCNVKHNIPLEKTPKHLVFVVRKNQIIAIPASYVVVGIE